MFTLPAKITLTTVKSFIRNYRSELHINVKSSFDGMQDCVTYREDACFEPAQHSAMDEQTLGVEGAWFVRGSRDRFSPYDDGKFQGIEVYNCCGSFVLAIPKS